MLVEDNGPIQTSKLSRAALAARAHWLTVEWLPKYARDLKAHHLAHQTFKNSDALDQAIRNAVHDRNQQRSRHSLAKKRISA